MSIADETLSFRYNSVHKYRLQDDMGGRRVWRNGLGWEIRHVTPNAVASTGRRQRTWRYDVFNPEGGFMGSEPTFWEASRTFVAAYCEAVK